MKNEILPAIAVIIFNDRNEVLLQKRRSSAKWCIISGHVEFGESLEEAVIREIMEELNVPAEIVRFIGVYSLPQYQTYDFKNKKTQYVTAYFEASLKKEIEDDFSNNETLELKYFSPDDLPIDMDIINPNWLEDALDKKTAVFVR
jgi:8-oxo-dGTP diphosphatase